MDWIRLKDIPNEYPIGIAYAKNLVKEFRAQTDDGWIKDGRVVIIDKRKFEAWWKNRSNQQQARK
jgi:hypothetical protein